MKPPRSPVDRPASRPVSYPVSRPAEPGAVAASSVPAGTPILDAEAGASGVLRSLRDVLAREPDLAEEVRRAGTAVAAAETLARIGAVRGIATDAAELRAHVARLAAAGRPQLLSDEALDAVAGGVGQGDDATWAAILNVLLPSRDRG